LTDKEKFLNTAVSYIGKNGDFVCNTKLYLNMVVDWCAFAVCSIMNDCGFVGTYINEITGGAGTVPRYSDKKYGTWFRKGEMPVQSGDLFFLRYADYPNNDKYFCDHIGIVENINGNVITTLEGNVDGTYGNFAKTSSFKRKTRFLSDKNVYAFYRPFWKSEKSTATSSKKEIEIYQLNSSKKVDYSVKVTASDGLNIRQGAGLSYKILGTVPCNSFVKVTNYTSGGNHKWGLIEYNGVKGWIALTYTANISKTVDELAHEVIKGEWGNGSERERKLTAAGYDYNEVQKRVNQILSKK